MRDRQSAPLGSSRVHLLEVAAGMTNNCNLKKKKGSQLHHRRRRRRMRRRKRRRRRWFRFFSLQCYGLILGPVPNQPLPTLPHWLLVFLTPAEERGGRVEEGGRRLLVSKGWIYDPGGDPNFLPFSMGWCWVSPPPPPPCLSLWDWETLSLSLLKGGRRVMYSVGQFSSVPKP